MFDAQTANRRFAICNPMTWVNAQRLKRLERPDGSAAVEIYRRNDGFYQFVVEELKTEEFGPHSGDRYWLPTHTSGFYGSSDDAEREAMQVAPWLKFVLS